MLKYGEYTWSQAKKKFSSPIGHSGAHCCKLRTTFGFSRTDNYNKIYMGIPLTIILFLVMCRKNFVIRVL